MADEATSPAQAAHETTTIEAAAVTEDAASPSPLSPDPADLPAPVGDPSHPGVTMKDGFYHFRDEFQLPKEPSVEDAENTYLAEVEKAFQNRWELHPNLIHHRNDAQKVRHAYDLDFRETEIKRIRDILPIDAPVFNYIDALVDVVMLRNLEIYVGKRFAAFQHISNNTQRWFACLFSLFAVVLTTACLAIGARLDLALEIALIPAIILALPLAILTNRHLTWPNLRDRELQGPKDKYEEAVRDAAGLAASKLASKGRDIENLMNSLKNKLDTLFSADATRVDHAPKIVRVLLWNPERMGLIENYYRAKMDQFMVESAHISIDNAIATRGLILFRTIFLTVLSATYILGLAIAFAMQTHGPVNGGADAMVCIIALLLIATITIAMVGSSAILAKLGHSFEPEEITRHNTTLQRKGLFAAGKALALGLVPMAIYLLLPHQRLQVILFSLTALLLTAVLLVIQILFAHIIFKKYEHKYSSNVLEAVEKKMDASQWTRYSDLRIDQRVAEVFNAIYQAWYKADNWGFTPSSHIPAAKEQMHARNE